MVIVFAHKNADAWETLVTAMIRAGFVVTASWPIDTEMGNRTRAQDSAALSSSVWLVCRKRSETAGNAFYNRVLPEMQTRITERLRAFWDMNVRGPDLVWSAVGPGLEAFSRSKAVSRLNGTPVSVGEFLKDVRKAATDFALGQIVHGGTDGLDDWTRYALMHRANFMDKPAPVGECILLAGAYGLDLGDLCGARGFLRKGKEKPRTPDPDDEDAEPTEAAGSGSEIRLLNWEQRVREDLGDPLPNGDQPYIDMLHRLVREWASGDTRRAGIFADHYLLGDNELFWRVGQAFLELATPGTRERSLLEAVVSWGKGRPVEFNRALYVVETPASYKAGIKSKKKNAVQFELPLE